MPGLLWWLKHYLHFNLKILVESVVPLLCSNRLAGLHSSLPVPGRLCTGQHLYRSWGSSHHGSAVHPLAPLAAVGQWQLSNCSRDLSLCPVLLFLDETCVCIQQCQEAIVLRGHTHQGQRQWGQSQLSVCTSYPLSLPSCPKTRM